MLLGYSNLTLPIQRQFVVGGMEGLRGYPWYRQENSSDDIIAYESGHTSSPYAFTRGQRVLTQYRISLPFVESIALE